MCPLFLSSEKPHVLVDCTILSQILLQQKLIFWKHHFSWLYRLIWHIITSRVLTYWNCLWESAAWWRLLNSPSNYLFCYLSSLSFWCRGSHRPSWRSINFWNFSLQLFNDKLFQPPQEYLRYSCLHSCYRGNWFIFKARLRGKDIEAHKIVDASASTFLSLLYHACLCSAVNACAFLPYTLRPKSKK